MVASGLNAAPPHSDNHPDRTSSLLHIATTRNLTIPAGLDIHISGGIGPRAELHGTLGRAEREIAEALQRAVYVQDTIPGEVDLAGVCHVGAPRG